MAANTYAPNGLTVGGARSRISSAGNYAMQSGMIKAGYGTAIGRGDLVNFGTGANQGFVVISGHADTNGMGVFNTVYPYYDQTAQQTMHGLNGSYPTTANPSSSGPSSPYSTVAGILCSVIADPFVTFIAQTNSTGGWQQVWAGQNINFVSGTNGVPNATGQSTLALDYASIAVDPALPFRIVGPAGTVGGPDDPNNDNCWLEVALNTSWLLNPTGI